VFIEEYLRCFNATEAALKAGYSKRSAYAIGSENLKKLEIKTEIDRRIEERAMKADEVLDRLAQFGRSDIGEFATLEAGAELADHPQSRVVKKFKKTVITTKDGDLIENIELELYDAMSALQLIGKHLGLFKENIDHTGSIEIKVVYDDVDDQPT
jgi:phage terminase small subunit